MNSNFSIAPTITATTSHEYRLQMERIVPFTTRVHIDLADGIFAPTILTPVSEVWWPANVRADLHVMYQNPGAYVDALIALQPNLVIVHAEADGDFISFATKLRAHGIQAGVALLQETDPEILESALDSIDHVLIFSGHLGYHGGGADLRLLEKVAKIKHLKPSVEISWDGGITDENAKSLIDGGIEVLNVGGYIHKSPFPQAAYERLATINQPQKRNITVQVL